MHFIRQSASPCRVGFRSLLAGLVATFASSPLVDAEEPSGFQFELRVVDPDGEPVSNALVQARTSPKPTKDDVVVGQFDHASRYGNYLRTNGAGRLVFRLAEVPSRFNISIGTPGYGPYWAEWRSNNLKRDLPAVFTAELERAWAIGGVVVDELGQPIEGASVHPSIEYKKRPGDLGQLGIGARVKTDADGRWTYRSVPESLNDLYVTVQHKDYQRFGQRLARDDYFVPDGDVPTTTMALNAGVSIRGTVTDEVGEPIEGALVRGEFGNDEKKAKTDEFGMYRLDGCEPGKTNIAVSAKGKALDKRNIDVSDQLGPVDFAMQPGGHIRIRIVDENGKGIPKARILYQEWRGERDYFSLDVKNQYADENGVWEWNEAPLDGFSADICRPGGMQLSEQWLTPRDEEYVFSPPPALIVSGKVVDAETGKGVEAFRVVPGSRWSSGPHWHQRDAFESGDGAYKVRLTHGDLVRLVRIEAVGYLPVESRDIAFNEGTTAIDFRLTPAKPLASAVLTPGGEPAARADVAIGIANAQISIRNGALDTSSTFCKRTVTDDAGRFTAAAEAPPVELMITHPSGFAKVAVTESGLPDEIVLTAWARVEGTFRVGANAGAGVTLDVSGGDIDQHSRERARIFTRHSATTNSRGEFVFPRVAPGRSWISREIVVIHNEGAREVTSTISQRMTFEAGETTPIDLGGSGRPVVGTLKPSPNHEGPVNWKRVLLYGQVDLPWPRRPDPPPQVAKNNDAAERWMAEWRESPAGKAWSAEVAKIRARREAAPTFRASVAPDGSFRIDDVPAGNYVMGTGFSQASPGSLGNHVVKVPPVADGTLGDPVDLGEITLSDRER